MRSSSILELAFLAALAGVSSGLGQSSADDGAETFAIATARVDVNGTTPLAPADSQVTIEAREEGSIVSALFGVAFGPEDRASIALQLSGELQKGEDERELANLHNLPGGVSATLKMSYSPANASSWARRRFAPQPLTNVCKQVNDELRARGPSLDATVIPPLQDFELKKGKDRYDAQRAAIEAFLAARERRLADLLKTQNETHHLSRLERAELEALQESEGTSVDILDEQAAVALCRNWNKGKASHLLLEEPVGTTGKFNLPQVAAPCTLATVAESRAKYAAIISCSKLPATIAAAREGLRLATSTAKAQLEAVQAASDATAEDESAARTRFTERMATARVDFERSLREAIALEDNKGELGGGELESAVSSALQECSDLLVASPMRSAVATETTPKGTAREASGNPAVREVTAPATGGRVAIDAEAKEVRATFEEAAMELAKATEGWSVATTPYITRGLGEVGNIACSPEDVLTRLPLFPKRLRNSLYRDLVAAVPSLIFWTVETSTASEDFKFLDGPLQADPESSKIKTTKESHYSYSGRAGLSLFVRGWLWTAGYSQEETWKALPSSQYCFPVGDLGGLTCASVAPKGPTKAQANTYDLQLKKNFSPSFALAAKVFYTEEDSITNPHLLLYFLPQGGKLRGGFDFSYVDGSPKPQDDGFAARLFVGLPFAL